MVAGNRKMRKARIIRNIILVLLSITVAFSLFLYLAVKYNPSPFVRLILRRNTSSWRIDFDSISYDRGVGYTISSFNLIYGDEILLTIANAIVKLEIGELISFVRDEGSSVEITADECTLDLTSIVEAYSATGTDRTGGGFSLYDFVMNRNFSASVDQVKVQSEEVCGDIDDVTLSYSSSERLLITDFLLDNATFSYPDYEGTVEEGEITLRIDEDIWIEGNVDTVELFTYGIEERLTSVTLSGWTDSVTDFFEAEFIGETEAGEVVIEYGGLVFESDNGSYKYSEKAVKGSSDVFSILYEELSVTLDEPVFSLSYTGDFNVSSASSNVEMNGLLMSVSELFLSGSLRDMSLSFTSPLVSSSLEEYSNPLIASVSLSDVNVDYSAEDNECITASFDASLSPLSGKLDDITFSSVFDVYIGDSTSFDVSISDFHPGFDISSPLSLTVSGNMENAEIKADSDNLKLDSILSIDESTVNGELNLDSLKLKNVLELILDREIGYLTETTLVSLDVRYDLGWGNSDGRLLGSADWTCSFDFSYLSLFTVLLSSSSSLVFNADKVLVNDLVISTPFFTLEGDGYYDLATGKPHIEFK